MAKPTKKTGWVSGGEAARVQEPPGSKKLTGFLKNEQPPFNFLNWLHYIHSLWTNYFAGNAKYNIIIDSDPDEGDYASMAAYIAASPAAGDRVLMKTDEIIAATVVVPDAIEITVLPGVKFTCAVNVNPVISFGDNITTIGDFRLETSLAIGTIPRAFSLDGNNNHHSNLVIEHTGAGTIRDGINIFSGSQGNNANGRTINSGAGSITDELVDDSGNNENNVTVRGDNAISRSNGANIFFSPTLITPVIASDEFADAKHDHSDNDRGGPLHFQHNVIIASSGEGDYISWPEYIADSPQPGDRILIKSGSTMVLAATLSVPASVEITIEKGVFFTLTANFSPIVEFGSFVVTKGDFRVENSNTGTIAIGFAINGDSNSHQNLILVNVSTGTITDAYNIVATKKLNYINAEAKNQGAGAITNNLTDASGVDSNNISVRVVDGVPGLDDRIIKQMGVKADSNPLNHDRPVAHAFSVRKSADQTITPPTAVLVTWGTKEFDTGNTFNLSTERHTPISAGKYRYSVTLAIARTSTMLNTEAVELVLKKNGTVIKQADHVRYKSTVSSGEEAVQLNASADMNGTTDYIEVFLLVVSAAGNAILLGTGVTTYCYFSGEKIDD